MQVSIDKDSFYGKKALVVGIARSGVAVAKFLYSKGTNVVLADKKNRSELIDALSDIPEEVEIFAGNNPALSEIKPDFLVVSPGVPLTVPIIAQAVAQNIPVLSELELAYRFATSPIIAITGTNGKTTTTSLTGEIFKNAGEKVCVGGNIGLPLVLEVEKYGPEDVIVAEVSSFQLECIHQFKPKVSVILNITPDHLDRHGTMQNYIDAKARIFENQTEDDFTVLNYDDPEVRKLGGKSKGKVIFFSRQHKLVEGIFVEDGQIIVRFEGITNNICSTKDVFIKGAHNLENAMASTAAAYVMGVLPEVIGDSLRKFRGVPHRLELVDEINGVKYVNDSKGTNPDASIKALEAYEEPIILLAGGRNKGNNFSKFAQKIKDKAVILVLFGECKNEIKRAVEEKGFYNILEAETMEEAVNLAAANAKPGEVVLLSPACASWDMFKDFEERGEQFKGAVRNLRR